MRENVRNFSIGIVSATALGGLAFLLLKFGEFTGFLESRSPVGVALNAAGGLREGSLVTLYGVPVGLVDRIGFAPDDASFPVRVDILIDRDTPIPTSAAPVVEASLLGSGARLELQSSPAPPGTPAFAIDHVPLLRGSYHAFDAKLIAALDERLASLRSSLETSLADFRTFATTYTALGQHLNDLVAPVTSEDAREGSLRTSVERFNQMLADTRDALRLARGWLSDEALQANVRQAVENANELFLRATDALNVINGFVANLDADRPALIAGVARVFDEARGALADLRGLLGTAGGGEGTIARLLNDPALYEDLTESARHLTATLDALRAVAERLKAEGIILKF